MAKHPRVSVYDLPSLPAVADHLELTLTLLQRRLSNAATSRESLLSIRGSLDAIAPLLTTHTQRERRDALAAKVTKRLGQ